MVPLKLLLGLASLVSHSGAVSGCCCISHIPIGPFLNIFRSTERRNIFHIAMDFFADIFPTSGRRHTPRYLWTHLITPFPLLGVGRPPPAVDPSGDTSPNAERRSISHIKLDPVLNIFSTNAPSASLIVAISPPLGSSASLQQCRLDSRLLYGLISQTKLILLNWDVNNCH